MGRCRVRPIAASLIAAGTLCVSMKPNLRFDQPGIERQAGDFEPLGIGNPRLVCRAHVYEDKRVVQHPVVFQIVKQGAWRKIRIREKEDRLRPARARAVFARGFPAGL